METCPDCEGESRVYGEIGYYLCMDCGTFFEDYEPLPYRGED